MDKYVYDESNGLWYELCGDYYLPCLTVPESTIQFEGQKTYVLVVGGNEKEKTYTKRYVKTGLSDGLNIQITSGLKKGETVRGPKKVAEEE